MRAARESVLQIACIRARPTDSVTKIKTDKINRNNSQTNLARDTPPTLRITGSSSRLAGAPLVASTSAILTLASSMIDPMIDELSR